MEINVELLNFINNLEPEIPKFGNVRILTYGICNYPSLEDWISKKFFTEYVQKEIILTFIKLNPPDNIKNQLISLVI